MFICRNVGVYKILLVWTGSRLMRPSNRLPQASKLLECVLILARDLAYIWSCCPHQYYLCATPPSGYDPYALNSRTSYLITLLSIDHLLLN
jgi:hypothetical protein